MATYALGGFNTLAQKALTRTIASQGYARSAFGYFMCGAGQPAADLLSIGRPNEGSVWAGVPLSLAQKTELANRLSYAPRIQGFKSSNTVVVPARGNMPIVNSPATLSTGQAVQNAANFNWTSYITTPIRIDQIDLDTALSGDKTDAAMGLAVGALIEDSTQVATNEHLDQLYSRFLYGSPTSQFVIPTDDIQGLQISAGTTNMYGCVDRSQLVAGDPWLGNTLATNVPNDIYAIVNDANYTQKLATFSSGNLLVLAGSANYIRYKNQILNKTKDAGIVQSKDGMGLPSMAKMGVEREVLRADNAFVMYEPFLDVCYGTDTSGNALYTATPGDVYVINPKVWKIMFQPKYNMHLRPFVDISDKSLAAPKTTISFIESRVILSCDRPAVGVVRYPTAYLV